MSVLTAPGVHRAVPDDEYHASRALSSTGARRLLQSPARFRWERDNPPQKPAFDLGHAVHTLVLGVGVPIVEVEADSWRTNAAKDARDGARAAGMAPILTEDLAPIRAMAEAVLAHPVARVLLERAGAAEASLIAQDPESGTWLRARPDFLPDRTAGRTVLVDLKTAISADPRDFGRTAANLGYHQQHAWYCDVTALARGDDGSTLTFVLVEKAPPHLVSVVELDAMAVRIGRERNRRAIDIFAECLRTDTWPGYPPVIHPVALPVWAERAHEEEP